jgi:cell wall-associated NlpC family hydrolase
MKRISIVILSCLLIYIFSFKSTYASSVLNIRNARDLNYYTIYYVCKQHKGYPYIWGGYRYKDRGFDCSGFICSVFKKLTKPIPRTTSKKYYFLFKGKSFHWKYSNLGDLVWFTFSDNRPYGHIGLITRPLKNKNIVYFWQSGTHTGPTESKLWKNHYWDKAFAGCKIGL